jgi:RNA:NAD 2'-phosphotransferase (TPT1/KptA family)
MTRGGFRSRMIQGLRTEKAEWASITATEIAKVIAQSDKKRHELRDGRIRALYSCTILMVKSMRLSGDEAELGST